MGLQYNESDIKNLFEEKIVLTEEDRKTIRSLSDEEFNNLFYEEKINYHEFIKRAKQLYKDVKGGLKGAKDIVKKEIGTRRLATSRERQGEREKKLGERWGVDTGQGGSAPEGAEGQGDEQSPQQQGGAAPAGGAPGGEGGQGGEQSPQQQGGEAPKGKGGGPEGGKAPQEAEQDFNQMLQGLRGSAYLKNSYKQVLANQEKYKKDTKFKQALKVINGMPPAKQAAIVAMLAKNFSGVKSKKDLEGKTFGEDILSELFKIIVD